MTIQMPRPQHLLLLFVGVAWCAVGSSSRLDVSADRGAVGGWDVQDDALLLMGDNNENYYDTDMSNEPVAIATFVQQDSGSFRGDDSYYDDEYNEGQVPTELRNPTLLYPLSCNEQLDLQANLESFSCSTPFSSLPTPPIGVPLTIPCGTCVILDETWNDSTLTLPDGLDIQGMLRIPSGVRNVIVSTPFVYVQGILQILTRGREWSPDNLAVKFYLTGTQDRFLIPHAENAQACELLRDEDQVEEGCFVGKKAFVVAGGRVDIRAAPSGDCPSWVHLQDLLDDKPARPSLSTEDLPFASPLPSGCPSRVLLDERWKNGANPFGWTGNTYATSEVTGDDTFLVSDREFVWQGPTLQLVPSEDQDEAPWSSSCMQADRDYLLRVRFRLLRSDGASSSNCQSKQTDCPVIHSRVVLADGTEVNQRWGSPSVYTVDDKEGWMEMTAVFSWTTAELAADKQSHLIWLMGPEVEADIEVARFTLQLPPADLYADSDASKICRELVPGEGPDGIQPPYPTTHNAATNFFRVVSESDGNKFYRLSQRTRAWHSIEIPILKDCVQNVKGSQYAVSLQMRIHSTAVVEPTVLFRVTKADGSAVSHHLPPCPPTGGDLGWVRCRVTWVLPDIAPDAQSVVLWVNSRDAAMDADIDYDDISVSYGDGVLRRLVLPAAVADSCWGVGSELVLTSPTTFRADDQVAEIDEIRLLNDNDNEEEDWAIVKLKNPIYSVTTAKQDPRFAVEVALLTRNVVIEGEEEEENPLHGGHFMVMNTPRGDQRIQGVEFRNMGQQAELGRYPLHFHMCGSVRNSVVSKNLVRQSHQRCFVIHGTHRLQLQDNVAFEARGHCVMLEDGAEIENEIQGNLVIHIGPVATKIKPDETDDRASGFWISNSRNRFVGNVAAGVSSFGFWLEMRPAVRGASAELPGNDYTPFFQPLLQFDDNVAHSCQTGIRTYPHGMIPPETAVMRNLRIYKNWGDGMFIHVVNRLRIDGGVFADNEATAIFQSKVNHVELRNLEILGSTDLYRELRQQRQTRHRCSTAPQSSSNLFGVQWSHFYAGTQGVTALENVRFAGFDDSECATSAAIGHDVERMLPHHNIMTSMINVRFESATPDKTPFVDACYVDESLGVDDVAFHDVQSTLHPRKDASSFKGVSAIVSNKPSMTTFLNRCQEMAVGSCVSYCEGACVRKVTFYTDAWGTEDWQLRISNKKKKPATIVVPGKFRVLTRFSRELSRKIPNTYDTTEWKNLRAFSVALPSGRYKGEFLNGRGQVVRPRFLKTQYEVAPPCKDHLQEGDIRLDLPPVQHEECTQLLNNGSAEDLNYTYWYHRGGGVDWFPYGGVDNTAAIRSTSRQGFLHGVGQYLDMGCLQFMQGHLYQLTAQFRLHDSNGEAWHCDLSSKDIASKCPEAILLTVHYNPETFKFDVSETKGTARAVGPAPEGDDNPFYSIHGIFPITERMVQANAVFLYFGKFNPHIQMSLDQVSLAHYRRPEACREVILNGHFASSATTGVAEFWSLRSSEGELHWQDRGVGGSGKALRTALRNSVSAGPAQQLDLNCLWESLEYQVQLNFRLIQDDAHLTCDPTADIDSDASCPVAKLRVQQQDGTPRTFPVVATVTNPGSVSSWGTLSGSFVVTPAMAQAQEVVFLVDQAAPWVDLVIDNVSIRPTTPPCPTGNWIQAEEWQAQGQAQVSLQQNEVWVTQRSSETDGARYELTPHQCLESQTPMQLTARIRPERKGQLYKCRIYKPTRKVKKKSCPVVHMVYTKNGKLESRQVATVKSRKAESDGYQRIQTTVVLTAAEVIQSTSLQLVVQGPPERVDLRIADMEWTVAVA